MSHFECQAKSSIISVIQLEQRKMMPSIHDDDSLRKIKQKRTRTISNLLFPAHRARKFLKDGKYAKRVGRNTSVTLAAVTQYLIIEMLALSWEIALRLGNKRIQPRHLLLAIQLDEEFSALLSHTTIVQGGVVPRIP